MPLSAYPRPKNDNGLGIHWSTYVYGQSEEATDYFVNELKEMGIKWVKFLNAGTEGRYNEYLVEQLVKNDIMPVMRIYVDNEALDLGSLRRLVQHYVPKGVYYYELYNEPGTPGPAGGWVDDPEPNAEALVHIWVPAARVIEEHGGYPSVPSIFPPSKKDPNWENDFFQQFFRTIKANGDTDVLYRAWGAVHNYFLNHPVRYPYDDVNQHNPPLTEQEIARYHLSPDQVFGIRKARAEARERGDHLGDTIDDDSACFLQFIAYRNQFYELFGFEIPLISTEGGATVGSSEDARYPKVDEQIQMEMTLEAYEYMLDEAPPYYFAFTTWLVAQRALDYPHQLWDSNVWYRDREGDHLPVVDALKNHPRRGETRRNAPGEERVSRQPARRATPVPATFPDRLSIYPRPRGDNGWGVHWSPTIMAQSESEVNYFVNELERLNIKWVKIMQGDVAKIEHEYLVRELVKRDIMPVLRIYKPYNDPIETISEIVRQGVPMGVYYYELYNEVNLGGKPGGWKAGEGPNVDYMLDVWIPMAEAVQREGGFPGLPTLAAGGDYDDLVFLPTFLDGLKQRGRQDLVQRAWLPLHNYFLNHPLDYPYDEVNLKSVPLSDDEIARRGLTPDEVADINEARQIARRPRSEGGYYVGSTIHQDSNSFLKFEAYEKVFADRFGFAIPIITTEGGAVIGNQDDPRYPWVTDEDVAELTLGAYNYMLDQAPNYYFAFTPWLLANKAAGHNDDGWEDAAWYKDQQGTVLPVVNVLKANSRRAETRTYRPSTAPLTGFSTARLASPATTSDTPPPVVPAKVYEEFLDLPTASYWAALRPTASSDPIYPYRRLDFERVGPAREQNYRAVIVDNPHLTLTILPAVGGRLYRLVDKASGQDLLYRPATITPVQGGQRGWWLAGGGLEWSFPTTNHGLVEHLPWDHYLMRSPDGSASVVMQRTEKRSGLNVQMAITLDPTQPYFTLRPKISNPTSQAQSFQLGIRGLFRVGDGSALQPSKAEGAWSLYAPQPGLAVVRVFPSNVAPDAQIAPQTTEMSGGYLLSGGLQGSDAQTLSLAPGQEIHWDERWYVLSGLDAPPTAADLIALRGELETRLTPSAPTGPTPTPTSADEPTDVEWDPRLDDLDITLIPANVVPGQTYWKLVKAEFRDDEQSQGLHHVYIETLDERGQRVLGQTVLIEWSTGSTQAITEDKPAPEYATNYPMHGLLGSYSVRVEGQSDQLRGLGLPGKHHVSYWLLFQRTVKR